MILGDYEIFYAEPIRVIQPSFFGVKLGWRIGNVLKIGDFEYIVIKTEPHQILLDRPLERSIQHGTPTTWVRNCRFREHFTGGPE